MASAGTFRIDFNPSALKAIAGVPEATLARVGQTLQAIGEAAAAAEALARQAGAAETVRLSLPADGFEFRYVLTVRARRITVTSVVPLSGDDA